MEKLKDRIKSPTPKFFRKLRMIGLAVAAAGTAILTLPISFPAAIITVAGYMVLGGSTAAAVSQVTKGGE